MRRICPEFLDSLMAVQGEDSIESHAGDGYYPTLLVKRCIVKYDDTIWTPINRRLVPGTQSGASPGPRNYRYIDRGVYNDVRYEYRLVALDYTQREEMYGPVAVMSRFIAPMQFRLDTNYPNPFRSRTRIRFSLPVASTVELNVYTLQGKLVRRLVRPDRKLSTQIHEICWDGCADNGTRVAAGPYIFTG